MPSSQAVPSVWRISPGFSSPCTQRKPSWSAPALELRDKKILSVKGAWDLLKGGSFPAQNQANPIMALVTALRVAYDGCDTDVFGPTPHEC